MLWLHHLVVRPVQAAWIHDSSRPHPWLWPHLVDHDMVEYLDMEYVGHVSYCLQTELVEPLNSFGSCGTQVSHGSSWKASLLTPWLLGDRWFVTLITVQWISTYEKLRWFLLSNFSASKVTKTPRWMFVGRTAPSRAKLLDYRLCNGTPDFHDKTAWHRCLKSMNIVHFFCLPSLCTFKPWYRGKRVS